MQPCLPVCPRLDRRPHVPHARSNLAKHTILCWKVRVRLQYIARERYIWYVVETECRLVRCVILPLREDLPRYRSGVLVTRHT